MVGGPRSPRLGSASARHGAAARDAPGCRRAGAPRSTLQTCAALRFNQGCAVRPWSCSQRHLQGSSVASSPAQPPSPSPKPFPRCLIVSLDQCKQVVSRERSLILVQIPVKHSWRTSPPAFVWFPLQVYRTGCSSPPRAGWTVPDRASVCLRGALSPTCNIPAWDYQHSSIGRHDSGLENHQRFSFWAVPIAAQICLHWCPR